VKINVLHKRHYGKSYFYPVDDYSKQWLVVIRREKAFTKVDLNLLTDVGVEVNITVEEVKL
jgi:hypothetical protein